MSQPPKPRQTGPPENPGVRELVAGKRRWSSPPKREDALLGFRGWHERGYLPHRDEPGLTQFVTFRLADALPAALRSEWAALWDIEDERQRRKELEAYLDKGHGECHLRRSDVARLVEDALRHFHGPTAADCKSAPRSAGIPTRSTPPTAKDSGKLAAPPPCEAAADCKSAVRGADLQSAAARYELRAWVVMPNHVHVLFKVDATPMSEIIKSWKRYTAKEANKLLHRRGAFWQEDYWDTYMRDASHDLKSRHYIENNPAKAFLVREPKEWPWSSARFRDNYGELRL